MSQERNLCMPATLLASAWNVGGIDATRELLDTQRAPARGIWMAAGSSQLDTQQGTSVAKVRIDGWDGGGGTLVGLVRWMDSGPVPAISAACTHLHCEEPQCLTAARTSKHMDLAGTDGAATTGAVAWRTSSSTSQLDAGAALDRPRTVVIHGRKL